MDILVDSCQGPLRDVVISPKSLLTVATGSSGTELKDCGTFTTRKSGCNVRSGPRLQEISTSYRDSKFIELEGKGIKRKNHQVLDINLTNGINESLDDDARGSAKKHSVDPKPAENGKGDGDTSRSEKRKKMDDALSGCARKAKPEGGRKDSLKLERRFRSDKQVSSTVERSRDYEIYHKGFEKKRGTWEREQRNRWSMTHVGRGDHAIKNSSVHERLTVNIEGIVVSGQKLLLRGNDDEAKRSKNYPKRSRDENLRGLVEAKKKKSDTKKQLAWKSEATGINHAFIDEAATRVDKEISKHQLRTFRVDARAEVVEGCRWANQTLKDGERRYGGCDREGSQEENGPEADNGDENVPVKYRERRIVQLHQSPGSFDGSSYRKDRVGRVVSKYSANPALPVGSECMRGGTGVAHDGTHRILYREELGGNLRADRRLESGVNIVSNSKETDDGYARKRSTYRVQEFEDGRKPSDRNADYLDRCSIKEKQELGSREVRKRDRCATIDLTRTKYESNSVIRNVWEVKRRFSSKIVVPKIESEERDCRDVSVPDRDKVLREGDEEERKKKVLADGGPDDGSQKATETIKNEYSTTREADTQKFESVDSKQGTGKGDPVHASERTLMHQENSKLVARTKRTSVEWSKESLRDNIKERQIGGKFRETKDKSELHGTRDDNRRSLLGKARALNKRSDALKSTRPEGTVSTKLPQMHLSKAVQGGKETNVNSKESLLRRQALKVGRARDDGGQRLSSHEPKHHKHRDRSHSVSPKLRNHSHQKKEYGKSMSPRRSEKDLSDWEKFERERNNTLAAFDSRYRRFGGGTSGLGGYSPRRRRSEAAIKTPSPPSRSPERRKPRAWDLPPPGMDTSMVAAISAAHQAAAQQGAIQHAAAAVTPLVSGSVLLSPGATSASASCGLSPAPTMIPSLLQQVNPAVTAVTLTQATRPLRRLYVGNVPATVSDGELLEFMNAAMLSANANHLAGTKPCINCSVNVDKSYAFAEFITPEDATAALAFDGVTLHGTTLKIRRPKDFAQPANGGAENASPTLDMVSSTVPDSCRKVFVGGISSSLSGEKVKEIVTAFGQLKAYHWEVDKTKQPPQAYAFLEYMDPSATLRACAGLNGMKLGTRFLTVVKATPDASPEVASTGRPSYGVPEHANPLLQAPSRILELQNLMTEDELRLMSKQQIDEIHEDIRLECSRFGNVKSMHIVQFQSMEPAKEKGTFSSNTENCEDPVLEGKRPVNLEHAGAASAQNKAAVQTLSVHGSWGAILRSSSARDGTSYCDETDEKNRNTTPDLLSSGQANICCDERSSRMRFNVSTNTSGIQAHTALNGTEDLNSEGLHIIATSRTEAVRNCDVVTTRESVEQSNVVPRIGLIKEESDASPREVDCLHVGKVYVEFSREESACQAAHNLHDRTFAGRKVTVSYFPLKGYQKEFHKGFGPRTYEEKQALALAVQGHLTAHIKD